MVDKEVKGRLPSPFMGSCPAIVMSEFFTSAVDIILSILSYLLSVGNYWFSAFFYIVFVFSMFVLVYQIFRR